MNRLALVLALSLWANVGLSSVSRIPGAAWAAIGAIGSSGILVLGSWLTPLRDIAENTKDTKEKSEDTNFRVREMVAKFDAYLMSIGCSPTEKRVAQRKFRALLAELHKD